VRTARAKGLVERIVLTRHALRNVLISLVTLIGLDLGYLLGGAIIVETVFAWPGLGRTTIQAISQRDFPVVQAAVIYMAFVIVLINFLVDMLYSMLDPRIRLR
jgi:ABC-type dipeptide/oligopeptide/nickel transport system permease component